MATAIQRTDPPIDCRSVAEHQDRRARAVLHRLRTTWCELAEIYADFRDHQRWMDLGMGSLDEWRESLGVSNGAFYSVLHLREKLLDIPFSERSQISQSNAYILKLLPESSRRNPDILRDAKTLTERAFARVVNLHLGDRAGHEPRVRRTWVLPESLGAVLDETMAMAAWGCGSEALEAKLEFILRRFMQSRVEEDNLDSPTIEDAWRARQDQ